MRDKYSVVGSQLHLVFVRISDAETVPSREAEVVAIVRQAFPDTRVLATSILAEDTSDITDFTASKIVDECKSTDSRETVVVFPGGSNHSLIETAKYIKTHLFSLDRTRTIVIVELDTARNSKLQSCSDEHANLTLACNAAISSQAGVFVAAQNTLFRAGGIYRHSDGFKDWLIEWHRYEGSSEGQVTYSVGEDFMVVCDDSRKPSHWNSGKEVSNEEWEQFRDRYKHSR